MFPVESSYMPFHWYRMSRATIVVFKRERLRYFEGEAVDMELHDS